MNQYPKHILFSIFKLFSFILIIVSCSENKADSVNNNSLTEKEASINLTKENQKKANYLNEKSRPKGDFYNFLSFVELSKFFLSFPRPSSFALDTFE